ncbi:MAG: LCP family protein, partial [Candidatus Doudnabacteria bacterium]|nr:LCP family protein [Candidatus Doudnabacteria bacterium]
MRSFDINQPKHPSQTYERPKKKRRLLKFLILLLILIGMGWASSRLLSKANQIFTNKENIFIRAGKLIIGADKTLVGEDEGVVNILLLGMGGPGHDGPLLTDTMIVASISVKTNEVVLISIPRDFVVALANQGFRKINSAYAYAELAEPGSGGIVAAAAVEKITGLTIPYYASIDFKGFVKAVDHVGGIDVTIDRTFT